MSSESQNTTQWSHVPDNLVEVSTSRSGVRNRETDCLLGVNNEDSPDLWCYVSGGPLPPS